MKDNVVVRKRYLASGFVDIEDTEFIDIPSQDKEGGAFYSSGVDKCSLRRTVFTRCSAKSGGAVAAKGCILMMYSTCFYSCSAGSTTENGGNSAYLENSDLLIDLSSSHKCAPDLTHFGDSVFQLFQSEAHATHMNFSQCKGENGECTFGSMQQSNSRVSYIHVAGCSEDSLCMLTGSVISLSNFIQNTLISILMNSNKATCSVENCYFFGNNINKNQYIRFSNCYGDFSTSGVSQIFNMKTIQQTEVKNDYCRFGYCKQSRTNNSLIEVSMLLVSSFLKH